ncbi:MAG: ribonuclease Z [Cyclobacteriaceae bacterium]
MTFRLKILGSNAAAPAHNRNQTSQLLQVRNSVFLIDCGEGTQLQLKKHKVKFSKINYIFISHLHGDHYYGLIGLISTMHLYGRTTTLNLFGPPGLLEIISLQLKYSDTSLKFDINFKEWTPEMSEVIFENNYMTVETFPLNHRISCSGFVFKEKPLSKKIIKENLPADILPSQIAILKKGQDVKDGNGEILFAASDYTSDPRDPFIYAFCSDTKFTTDIIPYVKNADLIYHEATFMEDMADRAELTYHSTAKQAAELAKKSNAKKLILGHFSTRYKELEPVLAEAKEIFENSYLGLEGTDFILLE